MKGLKVGLEFHQRLATEHKLFCNCSAELSEDRPIASYVRRLRPVVGELGEIDPAALEEFLKKKTFVYQAFKDHSCLVELDEAPPGPVNSQALDITLEIALLLNCTIVDEIHVMRKTVIDGSNTSGFQRTILIGKDGYVDTKHGRVEITGVYLEEEAAGIVSDKPDEKVYRLDRLGIPLVEISTGVLQLEPQQVKEVALEIGRLLRMTGKVQRGIGSIRQDINISIPGGARVEIKGVQEIRMLDKIIENEVKRQEKLIAEGKKVQEETRKANEDGTTDYLRVLPGSDRMYPETDIPSIVIESERLAKIQAMLPEKPDIVLKRLKEKYHLSEQLADKLVISENRELFQEICDIIKIDPTIVAITLEETLVNLKRRGIGPLPKKHLLEVFRALESKKMAKEAIPIVLEEWAKEPHESLASILRKAKLEAVSEKDIEKEVKELVEANKGLDKQRAFNLIMGKVMEKHRGKISGETIAKIVRRELG
jgi:Glu-tRNA(Gln) amidotransferase subunit E-like FAD-binding protein